MKHGHRNTYWTVQSTCISLKCLTHIPHSPHSPSPTPHTPSTHPHPYPSLPPLTLPHTPHSLHSPSPHPTLPPLTLTPHTPSHSCSSFSPAHLQHYGLSLLDQLGGYQWAVLPLPVRSDGPTTQQHHKLAVLHLSLWGEEERERGRGGEGKGGREGEEERQRGGEGRADMTHPEHD